MFAPGSSRAGIDQVPLATVRPLRRGVQALRRSSSSVITARFAASLPVENISAM
jgi:hypothetical protein